ncbi:Crp/Fnr family transcriptional regulator [Bacteroidota bacterium]
MMYEKLAFCPLFRGLSVDQIKNLLDSTTHQVKKYKKENVIAFSNDEVISQLFILEGSVKGEMIDFSGKTIKIEDIEAPRPLAPAFLFGKNNRYPVNIVANNNATILSFPKESYIRLLQKNEKVLENYLNIISNRAQFLSNKIKFLSFRSIKGKIAQFILQIMNKTLNIEIVLPKSQSQLAEMFGVTRPSLGRAIREMDQDGIIKATGKQITILDKQKLLSLLK